MLAGGEVRFVVGAFLYDIRCNCCDLYPTMEDISQIHIFAVGMDDWFDKRCSDCSLMAVCLL